MVSPRLHRQDTHIEIKRQRFMWSFHKVLGQYKICENRERQLPVAVTSRGYAPHAIQVPETDPAANLLQSLERTIPACLGQVIA